jgi:hypothetical protein
MTASKLSTNLINAAIYQVGWFACVLGAARGWGLQGALIAFGLSALHLTLAEKPLPEVKLLLAAGLIGVSVDSLHARFGILVFENHAASLLAPIWIIALWVQFGTVLHFCMRWLSGRYRLASLLGLIGGPLSFLGGERMGAAAFGEPRAVSITVLAMSWALALPALVWAADRLGGPGRYRLPLSRGADPAVAPQ